MAYDTGKRLIEKIKPLLSNSPIAHASIDISLDDVPRLTVEFILTDELIKAMQKDCEGM